MIRIAFFAPPLVTGGTQRHLQQVLRRLDPARFTARVYTLVPGGDVEAELRAEGVDVVSLSIGPRLVAARAAGAIRRVVAALRSDGVQIVHGYQWRPALIGAIAARLAGTPLVLASKRSLTGDDFRARLAWRLIARQVDTILVNADALRSEGEAHGIAARWALIPSGVDVDRFANGPSPAEAKRALGLDARQPVVGTIGRLEPRKGHEHFLEAARTMLGRANGLCPQVLIVGAGPLRERLAQRAVELGVAPIVRFPGSFADVRLPLAAMDVFVLPSNTEGMSNALLEAMAARRPVVATAVGGTREVLDGGAGVLVPPGNPEMLAGEIMKLLADPERAARFGEAAQRRVEQCFAAPAMVRWLEALYEQRLARAT
jgi:glycosyltransferase involved in cell wall biosynthesis